uniref:Uncharacterized protein n=1 Tax=Amphimedon queenslandica TaxID=400682 RepID=A0A1X7VX45_AMPQE
MYQDAKLNFLTSTRWYLHQCCLKIACNHAIKNEKEVRVNDYNPLLFNLWCANMDLQYIAERSLS